MATEEEKTEGQYDPISGLEDLASLHAHQIAQIQARFARLDKFLRDAQLVLYGVVLGLILAEIARV